MKFLSAFIMVLIMAIIGGCTVQTVHGVYPASPQYATVIPYPGYVRYTYDGYPDYDYYYRHAYFNQYIMTNTYSSGYIPSRVGYAAPCYRCGSPYYYRSYSRSYSYRYRY